MKKAQMMKTKFDKKLKKMENKCSQLENQLKEKEKESKLHSIKMKDIIRSQHDDLHQTSLTDELPQWNYNNKSGKKPLPQRANLTSYESEPNVRSRSIEPQRIRLRTKSKIDTGLKPGLKTKKIKAKLKKVKIASVVSSSFQQELARASGSRIPSMDISDQKKVADANGKSR